MNRINDPDYLRNEQYRDERKLEARINLHRRFSQDPDGYWSWMFDRLERFMTSRHRLLELGCGSGELWHRCQSRVPSDWQLTLTDLSPGMIEKAQVRLKDLPARIQYAEVDACNIPYSDQTFDLVMANHMLYHVPERERALKEIARILRPGGIIFASTMGDGHMAEIPDLVERLVPEIQSGALRMGYPFTLESGPGQLAGIFEAITVEAHPDVLKVTEAKPLTNYICSYSHTDLSNRQQETLNQRLTEEISLVDAISITRKPGLIQARKPGLG